MLARIIGFRKKLETPLRFIEYCISISVLWAGAVALLIINDPDTNTQPFVFSRLIDQYEVVSITVLLMTIIAIIDLYGLISNTKKSISYRSAALFGLTIGFFFVSALSVFSEGISNLLWINEFTLALISAVLYLNLKVGTGDGHTQ